MADYPVGYKKPPSHTQFKKGQSGNPKGRPKGVKNIATDIKEELEEFVQITEGNKTFLVTKQRALIKSLLAKASKGDVRAAQTLLGLKAEVDQREHEQGTEAWLEEEDLQIIEQFQARQAQAHVHSEGADDADE
jgi:hypothetical protein